MQFNKFDLGHLNLIRATYICQSLTRMGHQLSKRSDIPVKCGNVEKNLKLILKRHSSNQANVFLLGNSQGLLFFKEAIFTDSLKILDILYSFQSFFGEVSFNFVGQMQFIFMTR